MEFDENGKIIIKSLKKTIKHEERAFDNDDDYYEKELLVNYEKD